MACAALLSGRCLATAVVGSAVPFMEAPELFTAEDAELARARAQPTREGRPATGASRSHGHVGLPSGTALRTRRSPMLCGWPSASRTPSCTSSLTRGMCRSAGGSAKSSTTLFRDHSKSIEKGLKRVSRPGSLRGSRPGLSDRDMAQCPSNTGLPRPLGRSAIPEEPSWTRTTVAEPGPLCRMEQQDLGSRCLERMLCV